MLLGMEILGTLGAMSRKGCFSSFVCGQAKETVFTVRSKIAAGVYASYQSTRASGESKARRHGGGIRGNTPREQRMSYTFRIWWRLEDDAAACDGLFAGGAHLGS